jgi:hypothetical protein
MGRSPAVETCASLHGQETQDIPDLGGLLRSCDRGALDEGGAGGVGRRQDRQGRTGASRSAPICHPTSRRRKSDTKGVGRSRRSEHRRSANGKPKRLPPISARRTSAVRRSAGATRPQGGGITNGVRGRRRKRGPRWRRLRASMRRRLPTFGLKPRLSRGARATRTTAGKRNGSGCKRPFGGRANSPANRINHRDCRLKKIAARS